MRTQSTTTGSCLIGHLVGALCEDRQVDIAEQIICQAVVDCKEVEKLGLKREGLKVFRSLQLSLSETLLCQVLVEKVDRAGSVDDISQKLQEAEVTYDI